MSYYANLLNYNLQIFETIAYIMTIRDATWDRKIQSEIQRVKWQYQPNFDFETISYAMYEIYFVKCVLG